MNTYSRRRQTRRNASIAAVLLLLFLPLASVRAQLSQLRSLTGDRVEAATILGGDFGLSGATFTADDGASINLQKFGGGGDVGDIKPLGDLGIGWQPRLQGSMGYLTAANTIGTGQLIGAENKFHTFAIQFGGGARLWFNDAFSIAPTVMGMYGHTKSDFYPNTNAFAIANQPLARQLGLVDWSADTWTIRPALDLQYIYLWRRTIFTLSSDPTYFHTDSFSTSNPNVSVGGDSETWENKIDIDIPLGKKLFGHELRTGGSFSRTEFFGDIKNGLNTDYLYEAHGRLTLDYLNQLWKVQWIGIGASYLWGSNFHGYSIGADVQFRF